MSTLGPSRSGCLPAPRPLHARKRTFPVKVGRDRGNAPAAVPNLDGVTLARHRTFGNDERCVIVTVHDERRACGLARAIEFVDAVIGHDAPADAEANSL
jgi:hypothetical protein